MAKIVSKTEITLTRVIDVASNMRYYKLQSSTAAAPSKPTANPPSGWSTTEPSYTSGSTNTLYFVDCTIYSNGTFKYSDVSKSSSYEAAKSAYNKAQAAQDSVDNMEIGGRNLFYKSNSISPNWIANDAQTTVDMVNENGIECIKFTRSDGSTSIPSICTSNKLIALEWNSVYTVSLWLKFDADVSSTYITASTPVHYHFFALPNIPTSVQINNGYPAAGTVRLIEGGACTANVWKKIVLRVTTLAEAPEGYPYPYFKPYIHGRVNTVVTEVRMHGYKFEKGTKATDWTPAPEDLETELNETRQEFTDYQSSITNELGTIRTDASETQTILNGKISDLSELIGDIEGIDPNATVAKILKTYSSSIVQNSTDITAIINKQYQTSADVNDIVDAKALSEREYLQTYLRFNESGLTLGKSDSDFLAVLTNTMLAFRQSGLDVAYISNLALYITQAIIKERLVFGADRSDKQQFVWSFGDTGTLDLTYEGE